MPVLALYSFFCVKHTTLYFLSFNFFNLSFCPCTYLFFSLEQQSHRRNKSFTRGSNQKALAGKILVFSVSGCVWEVAAHGGLTVLFYYMATIVRTHWLAVSCNDQAILARYPRHIQSVFNLVVEILMDIHVMVNWQLSKRVSADQCHLTVSWAQKQLIELMCFLKVICWPVVGFNWLQAQVHNRKAAK